VQDQPDERPPGGAESPPAFEAPHTNGAAHTAAPAKRQHAPWEFLILVLLVLLVGIGIVLGWTLVGSHSPERLDDASAAAAATACDTAQSRLKALPEPNPVLGADRVQRIRAENEVLRDMVTRIAAVRPTKSTPAAAMRDWTADWQRMVDARARYADDLAGVAGTDQRVRFVTPASNSIRPITAQMDDFVRENHPRLDACFTEALQLERVEGDRVYKKVTK
jgi:hypothetical protein